MEVCNCIPKAEPQGLAAPIKGRQVKPGCSHTAILCVCAWLFRLTLDVVVMLIWNNRLVVVAVHMCVCVCVWLRGFCYLNFFGLEGWNRSSLAWCFLNASMVTCRGSSSWRRMSRTQGPGCFFEEDTCLRIWVIFFICGTVMYSESPTLRRTKGQAWWQWVMLGRDSWMLACAFIGSVGLSIDGYACLSLSVFSFLSIFPPLPQQMSVIDSGGRLGHSMPFPASNHVADFAPSLHRPDNTPDNRKSRYPSK